MERHSPGEEAEGREKSCSGTIGADFSGRSLDVCWEEGVRLLELL